MKCKECGASDREDAPEGVHLECVRCAYFPSDCTCRRDLGWTPPRWAHCLTCERYHICQVNTSQKGWRKGEV